MINKIKLIIAGIITIVLITLSTIVVIQHKNILSLENLYSIASGNEKALLLQNDSNKNLIRSLLLTIDLLDYINDSITNKLKETKQKLNIKDKDIKELQYLQTVASKTDTIVLKDTIFVDNVCIDTTLQDRWHSTSLKLCYPNEIVVTPSFSSEKIIVTHLKKETVDPPDKCWLVRLFQKKHTVVVVDITENNPYIETKTYRHIDVIKK